MSLRGFIRAFRHGPPPPRPTGEATDPAGAAGPNGERMSLRDAFGPYASADIEYGSEAHEEIVNAAPRSFYEQRERKWRDRSDGIGRPGPSWDHPRGPDTETGR